MYIVNAFIIFMVGVHNFTIFNFILVKNNVPLQLMNGPVGRLDKSVMLSFHCVLRVFRLRALVDFRYDV